jgi:hypothetical protein
MERPAINSSRELHEFFAWIDREMVLVQSVFVVDPQGYNSVSSRADPMQPYDNREREHYIGMLIQWGGGLTQH